MNLHTEKTSLGLYSYNNLHHDFIEQMNDLLIEFYSKYLLQSWKALIFMILLSLYLSILLD